MERNKALMSKAVTVDDLENFKSTIQVEMFGRLKAIRHDSIQTNESISQQLTELESRQNSWKASLEDTFLARLDDMRDKVDSQFNLLDQLTAKQAALQSSCTVSLDEIRQQVAQNEATALETSLQMEKQIADMNKTIQEETCGLNTSVEALKSDLSTIETKSSNTAIEMKEKVMKYQSEMEKKLVDQTSSLEIEIQSSITKVSDQLKQTKEFLEKNEQQGQDVLKQEIEYLRETAAKTEAQVRSRMEEAEKNIAAAITQAELSIETLEKVIRPQINHIENVIEATKTSFDAFHFEATEIQNNHTKKLNHFETQMSMTKRQTDVLEDSGGKMQVNISLLLTRQEKAREDIQTAFQFLEDQKKAKFETKQAISDLKERQNEINNEFERTDISLSTTLSGACDELQRTKTQIHRDKTELDETLDQMRRVVEMLVQASQIDDAEDKLSKLSLQLAELRLKEEHFNPKDAATHLSTVQDIRSSIAATLANTSGYFNTNMYTEYMKLLINKTPQLMQGQRQMMDNLEQVRLSLIDNFVTQVSTNLKCMSDDENPFISESRQEFRKKIRICLDQIIITSSAVVYRGREKKVGPLSAKSIHRPKLLTSTCVACDRPLDQNQTCCDDQEEEMMVNEALEEKSMRQNRVVSSFRSKRIDTTTSVKGVSGRSTNAPRSIQEPMYGGAYIYRGGFRLPRPQSALNHSISVPNIEMNNNHDAKQTSISIQNPTLGEVKHTRPKTALLKLNK